VLLTTQYLDEADQLADHVAVVDNGRVIASGTPEALKSAIGHRLEVVVADGGAVERAAAVLAGLAGAEAAVDADERRISVAIAAGSVTLTDVVRELDRAGVVAADVRLGRPTLDEVFLRLTGAVSADAAEEHAA
jgi:ABC-2 type transport system ATP-binding protein